MYAKQVSLAAAVAVLVGLVCAGIAAAQAGEGADPMGTAEIDLRMGGAGGVYFLAEPGDFWVEVEKRDRHRLNRTTELRAILAGPDRRVIQEEVIPDDGLAKDSALGEPGRVRLSTQVERRGVYVLNITISQDRYGDEILWGFRSNCPKYLIETSRGHRDSRHTEPILLLNPDKPANVVFMPRETEFAIELSGLPEGFETVPIFEADDEPVYAMPVGEDGKASQVVPAGERGEAVPWRLHLPKGQATVNIDGVTQWERNERYANLSLWTDNAESWFPFREYRWLLTPYSRSLYAEAEGECEVALQVHNNSPVETSVALSLEFPEADWPAELSDSTVTLGAGRSARVTLTATAPEEGEARVVYVRATTMDGSDFSTYSTVTVNAGEPPAARPLEMPLTLRAYEHENKQFGYLPTYPLGNQPYFSPDGQPYVCSGGIATSRDGEWSTTPLRDADGTGYSPVISKVAFDAAGGVYVLGRSRDGYALLHSADGGDTYAAYALPSRAESGSGFDVEQFSGNNVPEAPPPFVRITRTAKDAKLKWRSLCDLELYVPTKTADGVPLGEPIMVTDKCLGLSSHSGTPSTIVSRGTKVHVAWAEATDPEADVPGTPAYVTTYDRATGELAEPVLLGYGPPANDVHNSPSITMDSEGYLHIVAGTHGRPFPYTKSLQPNDAHAGWTEAVLVGEGLPQTYVGLVCGPDDTLHLACRLWRSGVEPFPLSSHATLAYFRKRPGQPWEAPRVLVVAAFSEYSIFYHRLTIDHAGRLFLSYDYWSTHWFYRNDHFGNRRSLLMSPDGGETWKLASGADLG